jgi:class 3 adenylate cyclase
MPTFRLPEDAFYKQTDEGKTFRAIKQEAFERFNPEVLGLGDIRNESVTTTAIAAFFDLQGFTGFCKQIEPQLSVPIYLSGFLSWIFAAIKKETICKELEKGVTVWHALPFFMKFMGDGLLVLWDTSRMSQSAQHNLILSCNNILRQYGRLFFPAMRRKVSDVPPLLRCGISKGTVFSVGNGEDYVGSCINVAARLQKLAALQIAFARRGFDPEKQWKGKPVLASWLLKKVSIRGIGQNELVYVKKADFEALAAEDQRLFKEP